MSNFLRIVIAAVVLFSGAGLLYAYSKSNSSEVATIGKSQFALEVSDTEKKRVQGLSDRKELKPGTGMLFVYDNPGEQCIWMKNMQFSIDILWLDKDKRVVKQMHSVSPKTFPKSFCQKDVSYVIELNEGDIRESGLRLGQRVVF